MQTYAQLFEHTCTDRTILVLTIEPLACMRLHALKRVATAVSFGGRDIVFTFIEHRLWNNNTRSWKRYSVCDCLMDFED